MRHIKLHVYTTLDEGIHEVILKKDSITRCENCTMCRTDVSEEKMKMFDIEPKMVGKYPTKIYQNGVELNHVFIESVSYIYELLKEEQKE